MEIYIEFIGHTMHLTSDGDMLTGCRWTAHDRPTPHHRLEASEKEVLTTAASQISEYLEGRRRDFTVPLRIEGSDFREKVWNELRKIPYGATISYKELARRIGSPNACRAVANACGANPFPIIIPCHRVVGSDGKTGGYTGGLDIKTTLLGIEKQNYRQ